LDGFVLNSYGTDRPMDPVMPYAGVGARVVRGGSFSYAASGARSAARDGDAPDYRDDLLGLRPARHITP
jgi:formylglycine-generating enzyme required for sulfatase activity